MHTEFPVASHCVLGACAAVICKQSCLAVVNLMGKLLLPPEQHQGTCPAEKFDHQGTMNPRGPQTRLFVGSKNTSWCQSEQPKQKEKVLTSVPK